MERSFDVFVCYHELGASDYAEQIFKTLTERKFSVYVDHLYRKTNRGIIHENIDNIIKNCRIFVLLNTIDSLNRDEIIREFKIVYPTHNFEKPKLWIFTDTKTSFQRNTEKFKQETKIDLSKLYHKDFNSINDITRIIIEILNSEFSEEFQSKPLSIKPKFKKIKFKKTWNIKIKIPNEVEKLIINFEDEFLKNFDFENNLLGDNHNFQSLEDKLSKIFNLDPSNIAALLYDGIVKALRGKYEEAEKRFSQAISINSNISESWNNKAISLYHQEKYYEALRCINRAIEIDKKDLDYLNFKGNILFSLEKNDESVNCYNKVLDINKINVEALVGKASILSRENKDEAVKLLEIALNINDKKSSIWYNFGVIRQQEEKDDDALKMYRKAVECDDDEKILIQSLNNIGIIYRKKERYNEAISAYDKAIELDPNNSELLLNKGITLGFMGKTEEALEYFNESININPLNNKALDNRIVALIRLKKDDDALKEIDNLLKMNDGNIRILEMKMSLLLKKELFDDIEKICQRLIELEPKKIEYVYWMLDCLLKQNKNNEYNILIEEFLKKFPNDEILNLNSTHIDIQSGKL